VCSSDLREKERFVAGRIPGVDHRRARFHHGNRHGNEDRGIAGVLVAGDPRCREHTRPGLDRDRVPMVFRNHPGSPDGEHRGPVPGDNRQVPVRGDTIGRLVQQGCDEHRGIVQFGDGEEKGHVLNRGIVGKIDGIIIIVALALAGGLVELPGDQGKEEDSQQEESKDEECPKSDG